MWRDSCKQRHRLPLPVCRHKVILRWHKDQIVNWLRDRGVLKHSELTQPRYERSRILLTITQY
jgi:hypothetical protein